MADIVHQQNLATPRKAEQLQPPKIIVKLINDINHHNICKALPCVRCHKVSVKFQENMICCTWVSKILRSLEGLLDHLNVFEWIENSLLLTNSLTKSWLENKITVETAFCNPYINPPARSNCFCLHESLVTLHDSLVNNQ